MKIIKRKSVYLKIHTKKIRLSSQKKKRLLSKRCVNGSHVSCVWKSR